MDYSDPLLLPKAADLLTNISKLYMSEIDKAELKYIPFEITSATRTIESVKRLEKDNDNAIKNYKDAYAIKSDYESLKSIVILYLKKKP